MLNKKTYGVLQTKTLLEQNIFEKYWVYIYYTWFQILHNIKCINVTLFNIEQYLRLIFLNICGYLCVIFQYIVLYLCFLVITETDFFVRNF